MTVEMCRKGLHPVTPETSKIDKAGRRRCIPCTRKATLKASEAARLVGRVYVRQETCGTGLHPMSGDNLGVTPKGKRYCRACKAARCYRSRYLERGGKGNFAANGAVPPDYVDWVIVDRLVRGEGFCNRRGLLRGPTRAEMLCAIARTDLDRTKERAELLREPEWKLREAYRWARQNRWTPPEPDAWVA